MLIAGLNLNERYAPTEDSFVRGNNPFSLLDYAMATADYLGCNKRSLTGAMKKVGGSFGGRHRFIADTIAMLREHGAKTGEELTDAMM